MAIKHLYTIMCDEVRRAANGKLIIIGMYTPNMGVPQIPYQVRALTFFVAVESDTPEEYTFRIKLSHLESGKVIVTGNGGIQFQKPGESTIEIPLPSFQFQAIGSYTFSVELPATRENLLIQQFLVELWLPKKKQGAG